MAYDGFAKPTGIEWGNADKTFGQVKFGDDSQLVVIFYTKSVFNAAKSAAEGTRQYDNHIFVKIHPPGERLNVIDRPVQDADKHRFSHQWSLFLQNRTQVPDGTPIDLLFPNNPAIADSLKSMGVYTIQQCANLSSNAIETIGMGGREWVNKAVQYLDNAKSGSSFLKLQAESDKKDQQIKLLERKVNQLTDQLNDVIGRINNPNSNLEQPGWVKGYDVQEDRLNANHPSTDSKLPKRGKKVQPKTEELEQHEILRQVSEEDIPIVDITKLE